MENITHEEIAIAAYYIWLHQREEAQGLPEGWDPVLSADHNWYLAEKQLEER